MTDWLGMPGLASAHGAELDHTMGLVHLLMLALFVGWGLFFVYALVRFRKGRQPVADHAGVKSKASTWLEVGVAVAEAVLLLGFSIPLWSARVDAFPARSEAVEVRVVGEQFAWNVHYPGPDGRFGKTDLAKIDVQANPLGLDRSDPAGKDDITTVNQLHLPVGKPVIVHLSSKDVIHSFALQEMRVKQDAVPGLSTPLWFVPTVTTEEMRRRRGQPEWNYEISCAQLCGLGHYRMRGFVTVETPEAYDKWIADQVAQLSPDGGDFWQ